MEYWRQKMLELKNIIKSYKNGTNMLEVLKGTNLTIEKGDFVSIKGPSGSGKTTLFNIIGALDRPDTGLINFDGKNINLLNNGQRSLYRNHKIGFIFQNFHLIKSLNIKENIFFPAYFNGEHPDKKVINSRYNSIIDILGIRSLEKKYPNEISGGEMQRTAIGRALINNPNIVIADEPTANLDTENGEKVISLLKEINSVYKTAIIFCSHDDTITAHASRQLFLQDGVII
jgi:putative ABC transport system ATP-binding protein